MKCPKCGNTDWETLSWQRPIDRQKSVDEYRCFKCGVLFQTIRCPNCGEAELEQHRRRPHLLICPKCWYKYEKEDTLRGEFIRVKAKPKKISWAHPRGY